jgi:hypothetical protein
MSKEHVDSKEFIESQKEIFSLSVKAEKTLSDRSHGKNQDGCKSYKNEFLEKVRKHIS